MAFNPGFGGALKERGTNSPSLYTASGIAIYSAAKRETDVDVSLGNRVAANYNA